MDTSDSDSKPPARPEAPVRPQNGGGDSREESEPPWRAEVAALPPARRSTPGRRRTFPIRLHTLLSDVEISGQMDIISWQPHGRCFIVRKTDEFVEQLLPRYFNQNKWSSFQRQLNLYSFERITAGVDRGAYYHPNFVRGAPALSHTIPRVKVKGTRIRVPADVSTEPNFYTQPNQFQPQLRLSELEQVLYPSLLVQMAAMPNSAMPLQQPNAATETGAASGNAIGEALLQSLGLLNPQAVNPVGTQALLARQLGLTSTLVPSMPDPLRNVDRLRQLTNAATPLALTSDASENMNATSGSTEVAQDTTNPTGEQVWKPVADTSVWSQEANHCGEVSNHETTLPEGSATPAESATLPAAPYDDNADLKPAAIDRNNGNASDKNDPASELPRTTNVGDRAVVVSDDSGANMPEEGAIIVHNTLESTGKSTSEGDLNRPPPAAAASDDQDMGKFLKRCFDL